MAHIHFATILQQKGALFLNNGFSLMELVGGADATRFANPIYPYIKIHAEDVYLDFGIPVVQTGESR
jgi:hypothetical protein